MWNKVTEGYFKVFKTRIILLTDRDFLAQPVPAGRVLGWIGAEGQ